MNSQQDRQMQLRNMLEHVDVSAPSVSKFNSIKSWASLILGVNATKIAVYYVSKPGNFDVRFAQPGVQQNKPIFGIALIPPGGPLKAYELPARRLVKNGDFEALAICEGSGSNWQVIRSFAAEGTKVDASLGGLVNPEDIEFIHVAPPSQSSERSPAESGEYNLAMFIRDTGIDEAVAKEWLSRLLRKKQVVLQGPPGTGKTFIATRLARLVVGSGGGILDVVQFHPAFGYEDFISGITPVVKNGVVSYEPRPGRFLDFCSIAEESGAPSVLVIDEFNRADLPRVFGEIMYLLEYRDKKVLLANGPGEGRFEIPSNVYLVATMNTADRSAALLDHALRRRFSFIRIQPDYNILQKALRANKLNPEPLVSLLRELNGEIGDQDFEIGISFFIGGGSQLPKILPSIWEGEIEPYVREIMHARPDDFARWTWSAVSGRLTDLSITQTDEINQVASGEPNSDAPEAQST